MPLTCSDCRFYEPFSPADFAKDPGGEDGRCCLNPPTLVWNSKRKQFDSQRPDVFEDDVACQFMQPIAVEAS